MPVHHTKEINLSKNPDLTQAQLNELISRGQFAPGTLLADIALNSNFNGDAAHVVHDLTVSEFASPNISQWTNDAGYLSSVTGNWTGTFDGLEGAAYLARANHTGTQLKATISDFVEADYVHIAGTETITGAKTFSSSGCGVVVNDNQAFSKFKIEQSGTGDAAMQFLLTGVRSWTLGIDNSDSDKFKISAQNDGFATPSITIDTSGNTTILGTIGASNFSGTHSGTSSNTNTGDQTSIVGITGTKAQFDTACTDGNFLYVGDVTQYTDEMAQDAVGAMVDTTLVYVDATPLLTRGAIAGDISVPQASNTSTLATVNSNVGSFGSATQVGTFTVNAKGLTTAAANVTITPAVGSITGFGTGVATALGVNNGTAGAFVVNGGVLGTPSSGTATNLTGIASGLTAGSVTNATFTTALTVNTGTVTLTGNAANTSVLTIGAGAVSISGANTGDQTITLTGAVTGSGTGSFATTIATPGTLTVSSTNSTATAHTHAVTSSSAPGAAASILATDSSGIIGSTGTRIVKGWFTDLTVTNAISGSITGNASTVTTNANLTGPITSAGNATSIASQTGTGTKFVVDTSPTVITPTFTTSATVPLIIAGSSTTQSLTYQTTTGVGAAGADHIFLVGNNGATEAMRILNNASIGVGTSTPNTIDGLNLSTQRVFHVSSSGLTRSSITSNGGASSDYIDSGAAANQKWFVLQNINGVAYYRALSDAAAINFQLMNFNLSNGNIKIAGTAARGTTEGTNHLDIFDGTAPVGTLANGGSIYSVSGITQAMDSTGNNSFVNTVRKFGRSTAQTAAVASVAAYTVGAADGTFEVSANVLVTAATLHNFTVTCAYTDEGNTARTLTLSFSNLGGAIVTAIANAGGTVPYEGVPLHIRAKAATAITIATTGTFTTTTYNVEGMIRQIQ